RLLTFQLTPSPTKYPTRAQVWPLYQSIIEALGAEPDVAAVAVSSGLPFGGGAYTTTPVTAVGASLLPPGQPLPLDWRMVSPGYLTTLGIPLVKGRFIEASDTPESTPVVVITRRTAELFWGKDEPVGRAIRIVASGKEFTVVGVVGDVLNASRNQP